MTRSTTTPRSEPGARRQATRRRSHPPRPDAQRVLFEIDEPRAAGRDKFFRRSLAVADVVAAALALVLAVTIVSDATLRPAALLIAPLVVLIGKLAGLYDRDELVIHKTTIEEAPALFHRATAITLLVWLAGDLVVTGSLGRAEVLILWVGLLVFSILFRRTARQLVASRTSAERCLVVGDAATYARLQAKFETHSVPAQLVGRLSQQRITGRSSDRAADEDSLRNLVEELDVHRIIIVPSQSQPEMTLELVRAAKGLGVTVSVVPAVFDVVGTAVVFDHIAGMTLLGVRRFGLSWSSRFVKRTLDLVGSMVILLLTAPVLAALAVAIKLDSPGPVFFRQVRVGKDGKRFGIFKFRTMVADAESQKAELLERNEASGLFKMVDDPRITRVGRILRKTSLDELPQLFNVVRGEMSLVGPRPLVLDEDEIITGYDRRRLQLTPGMTGHWQILGSARIPLAEMVKIDYLYVAGWSLWADIKILLRTVPYMLARKNQ